MRALSRLLAFVFFSGAAVSAQVAPYVGGGIGVNGLSFQSPYFNVDAGVDWGNRTPIFVEGEVGADTANPNGSKDGTTFRAQGVLMWRATTHWRIGGGVHFSELFTSRYDNHGTWPTVGAMFEQDWFRLNAQYLIPTGSDYSLTGPLFDMRMHIRNGFYFRERVGIYAYRNPNEPNPSHHVSAVADFGILYVFR
jgi:hypothetical protein